MKDFSAFERNPGHWDISATPAVPQPGRDFPVKERAFCIRGEPGKVTVRDERTDPDRPFPRESLKFKSVQAAMAWICDELMAGPVVAQEGEELVDSSGNPLVAVRTDRVISHV